MNLAQYRLAFECLRLLNIEFLSLCAMRVSQKMTRTPEELKANAEALEKNIAELSDLAMRPAA